MNLRLSFYYCAIACSTFLTGCFSGELKEIQLNAVTGHLISIPMTSDTLRSFQVDSSIWVSDINSVLINAGVSAGEILEARPTIMQASIVDPDSTLRGFDEFSVYIQYNNKTTLMGALEEGASLSGRSTDLFVSNIEQRDAFFSEQPQLLIEYERNYPTDTIWTVELLILWELKGEI